MLPFNLQTQFFQPMGERVFIYFFKMPVFVVAMD